LAIDPRKLKPTELVRLLNSTPLGEVISERQLHRHRARAGFRIGDGRTSRMNAGQPLASCFSDLWPCRGRSNAGLCSASLPMPLVALTAASALSLRISGEFGMNDRCCIVQLGRRLVRYVLDWVT